MGFKDGLSRSRERTTTTSTNGGLYFKHRIAYANAAGQISLWEVWLHKKGFDADMSSNQLRTYMHQTREVARSVRFEKYLFYLSLFWLLWRKYFASLIFGFLFNLSNGKYFSFLLYLKTFWRRRKIQPSELTSSMPGDSDSASSDEIQINSGNKNLCDICGHRSSSFGPDL